jgi:dihydrofolate reductase
MKKYVVSTTLKPEWNNSVLFKEHPIEEIRKVKAEEGGDILVAGSGELISSLIENDLIDEYRLLVYPLVLGTGKKLFTGKHHIELTLTEERKFEKGVTLLRYEPVRTAPLV